MADISWDEFQKAVDGGGSESVMTDANTQKFEWTNCF